MAAVKVSLPNISVPFIDRQTGLISEPWYKWFEQMQERTGGDVDQIADNTTTITLKANKDITIEVGNGLIGGGTLENDLQIFAKQDTGWTAATGAGDKGAYTQYPGQTVSAGYVQAEAQATDDALKAVSARVVGIEEALRNNGAIDG